jgi:hypothetical protein
MAWRKLLVMVRLADSMIALAQFIFTLWKEHKLKIIFSEILCDGVDWIHLAEDRIRYPACVNVVMNLLVP